MTPAGDGSAERARAHLERRTRLALELSRLSEEATRLSESEAPAPWWLRLRSGGETGDGGASPRAEGPRPAVTVVVPVHNAHDELAVCLRALARHTTHPAALLLIDDASTDPRIGELLEMAAGLTGVEVLRNVENVGFTATVNRALRSCDGDVVLLNSDTAVGPRWLEQLVASAYADPRIATVTPVSDNAGAFSVPAADAENPLPAQLSVTDVARLIGGEGPPELVDTPTGSGFCLYVKRAVIEAAGEFDAAAFPKGYGEENDFCMRTLRLGWRNVVDGRTYVHHERESSFGPAKAALAAAARAKLDELHPDYTERVRAFVGGGAIAAVRERVGVVLSRGDGTVRPRLLFVIHEGGGGAIATNQDLMRSLQPEFDGWMFSSDRSTLRLARMTGGTLSTVREWPLERPILLGDFSRPDYREAFAEALDVSRPELVHVRHVFKHTLDAPKMAAAAAVPIVMSIHDHYTLCPTIHLLDDTGHYCGGICSPGHGTCQTLVKAGPLPPLKHAFVYQWREEMAAALRHVDTFVTTSPHARDVHRKVLPAIRDARFDVIEHGRDLRQASGLAEPPRPGGAIRVLVPGHLDRHKGAELIEAMLALDTDRRLELHFAGGVPERWRGLGTMHGTYDREHYLERVGEVRPAFVGIFSVVAETYNHALTEAWAAGVPVLATDLGAQGERVRAHGGGFLLPVDDPAEALAAVLAAADDPAAYAEQARLASLHDIPSVAAMTARYAELYRDVLGRRRSFAAPRGARGEPLGRGIWRASVVAGDSHAAYVRVRARLRHPEVEWKLRSAAGWADDSDVAVVHAASLAPESIGGVLDTARRVAVPLVVVADGDTTRDGVRRLVEAATLVIVPRVELAAALQGVGRRVVVHPDRLDERLFGVGAEIAEAAQSPGPARLLWARPSGEEERAFVQAIVQGLDGVASLEVVESDGVAYPEFARRLTETASGCTVALAPALGGRLGELRALEYAGVGVPVIASERLSVSGGIAVADDPQAWCAAIAELAGDPELRVRLATEGRERLVAGRLVRQGAEELLEAVGSAIVNR